MILGIRSQNQMLRMRDDTPSKSDLCEIYSIPSVHTCLLTCTDPQLHSVVVTLTPGTFLKDRILRIRLRTQMLKTREDTPSESDGCVLYGT